MELITILNHCYHLSGICLPARPFQPRQEDHRSRRCGRARARRRSARAATNRRRVMIIFPSGASSSFLSGAFWFSFCTACDASNAAACGVVVEKVPWSDGKHQLTRAYMLFLARWARKLSWKETAEAFQTSWDKVCDAVEYVVPGAWSIVRSNRSAPSAWMKSNTPKATST